ncbi:thioredoxin family protein [Deinococcus sp.]|uniref:thioredoxin family protein n=1 Tax=Deinococcus sp. TaxID=47478 RepID=UPI003CC5DCBB
MKTSSRLWMQFSVAVLGLSLATQGGAAAVTRPTAGVYEVYTKQAFDAAQSRQRVLFFHATWCPTCKQTNADIVSHLKSIPANLVIFKTDYDSETALKRQYGITYQHTFVLVDASGKALKKWAGGDLAEIVANVK